MRPLTRNTRDAGTTALLLLLLTHSAIESAEIRDRITPAQMRQRQATTTWKRTTTSADRDPRIKPPVNQSIIKESVIISDGHFWSLVPKKAILHISERQRRRLVDKPVGKLLPWKQFLGRNRSWLRTLEVDIPTAAGNTPISNDSESSWAKRDCIVVAVHRGGPISVKRSETEKPPATP
ncbi:MAG: hypothetical protein ACQCXQ_06210 [Verrucomicrobiales bacterium]|nr:hypothetical protein [Verrucomicrobiota bacterium JB025]